jgi:hypothetical protein
MCYPKVIFFSKIGLEICITDLLADIASDKGQRQQKQPDSEAKLVRAQQSPGHMIFLFSESKKYR